MKANRQKQGYTFRLTGTYLQQPAASGAKSASVISDFRVITESLSDGFAIVGVSSRLNNFFITCYVFVSQRGQGNWGCIL